MAGPTGLKARWLTDMVVSGRALREPNPQLGYRRPLRVVTNLSKRDTSLIWCIP